MCAIDSCDEPFEVYRKKRGRARKPHECGECGRTIGIGETYLYAFGVYEGRGESYYICAHCSVAADWLTTNCGGFLHGGVEEDIGEHIDEYPNLKSGLYRFKIGMRRKWKRFLSDGLMPLPPQAQPITVTELQP